MWEDVVAVAYRWKSHTHTATTESEFQRERCRLHGKQDGWKGIVSTFSGWPGGRMAEL